MYMTFDDEPKGKDIGATSAEQGEEAREQYAIYVDARLRVWAAPDFHFPSSRTKYVRAADYDALRFAIEALRERHKAKAIRCNFQDCGCEDCLALDAALRVNG